MSVRKLLLIPILCSFVAHTQAADLRACEKAKLRQLSAERAAHNKVSGGKQSKSSSGRSKTRQDANQLDEWLWKNCRDYAQELRTLEQERM